MKINAKMTKYEDVELDKRQVVNLIEDVLTKVFNIPGEGYSIEEGNLMRHDEYHTSHSWFETEVVRKATKDDKAVIRIMRRLREIVCDANCKF